MGELNNAGRDYFHTQAYTNTGSDMAGRSETVIFANAAIVFTHVEECKGWYRDNTCTCPKDDCDEDE